MNKNITVGMLFAELKEVIEWSDIEHEKIVSMDFDAESGELVIETEGAVYPIAIGENHEIREFIKARIKEACEARKAQEEATEKEGEE